MPITIPIPEGDAMWPWIVAGDDGRVAVAWLQNLKGKPNEFYWYVAMTTNGHGSTVACSDGSTKSVKPQFAVANASTRPVHVGAVCLNGTNCNASPGDAGDRRLGDFITVNFDKDGQLFVTGGDTTLPNPAGGKKVVGNPLFAHASAGSTPMIATPMETRPSRPLCLSPTCF